MARYSIEDTTLTAIGDAIRGKVGDMKEGLVPLDVPFNMELDVTKFNPEEVESHRYFYFYTPYVNDVASYKVVYSFINEITTYHKLSILSIEVKDDDTKVKIAEKTSVSRGENIELILQGKAGVKTCICLKYDIYYGGNYKPGLVTASIYPLDADGNIIDKEKKMVLNTMTPIGMAEAINNIPPTLPDSAFNITGNCQCRFYRGAWDWFIELFGDKIKTNNINNCNQMFYQSEVEAIPFDINITSDIISFSNIFGNCSNLKSFPKINVNTKIPVPTSKYNFVNIENFFNHSYCIREIPDDYLDILFADGYWEAKETLKADGKSGMVRNMYSLRRIPTSLYKAYRNYGTAYYYSLYNNIANTCYSLDEIIELPVEPGPYTSNCFSSSFQNCNRLSRVTFEINEDGTPKTANWKSQTIDLNDRVGYLDSYYKNNILNYNSGITADKEVKNEATYAALKNDPDWFATLADYSRYNKLSAIETINTLPDVSASGGVNTIKFKGVAGAKTDGGAINTMTEEEIAVATAKGWTVTMT